MLGAKATTTLPPSQRQTGGAPKQPGKCKWKMCVPVCEYVGLPRPSWTEAEEQAEES